MAKKLALGLILLFVFLSLVATSGFAQTLLETREEEHPAIDQPANEKTEAVDSQDTSKWTPQQWEEFWQALPGAIGNIENRLQQLEQREQETVPVVSQEQAPERENLWDKLQDWLRWWWKWGLLWGFLWWLPWFVYSWQWWRRRFWVFVWPWPWWWWLPWFWFIPWLWWGWWWHPFCFWFWWCWFWWWIPWIFWIPWWLIVLKHVLQWLRKNP